MKFRDKERLVGCREYAKLVAKTSVASYMVGDIYWIRKSRGRICVL